MHNIPTDLQSALTSNSKAHAIWNNLTPLARNEWICWVISVKKDETRKQHIQRVVVELNQGEKEGRVAGLGVFIERTRS